MYYIYKTTNLVNGKTYIGKHKSEDVLNDLYIGSGTLLRKAIKKYGKENFKNEILEVVLSSFEANWKEIYFIKKEKSIGKAEYNIAAGGQGGSFRRTPEHIKHFIESRKKGKGWQGNEKSTQALVEWTKKFGHSEKWRKDMSEKLKGHPDFTTPEGISKMSGTLRKKYSSGEIKVWNSRKIVCVETGQVFSSQAEAAHFINRSSSAIVHSMKRENGTCGGFHWKWEE